MIEWMDAERFRIDGETYLAQNRPKSKVSDEHLVLFKPRRLVERHHALLDEMRPNRIVELGIFGGGSVAFTAQVAEPETLVAIEISGAVAPLERFVQRHQLADRVHLYFGVDQSDRRRVGEIMDARFGSAAIDLVVDDASHQLDATRASFETLLPRLRPGGRFVLEDWSWQHDLAAAVADLVESGAPLPESKIEEQLDRAPDPLLTRLVAELVLAQALAGPGGAIEAVTIDPDWVTVVRGAAPLDRDFRLTDLYEDHFDVLPGWLDPRVPAVEP